MRKSSTRARILPRTEFGDPILTRKAKRVTKTYLGTTEFKELVRDMVRTMRATKGVGLAAPQVGVPLRIAVLEIRETPERKGEKKQGPLTIINPRIVSYIGKPALRWEGCLSFHKVFGRASRYPRVRVSYMDEQGIEVEETVSGLWGHIFQHEIDHLEGIRFIDRLEDASSLVTAAEYKRTKTRTS
jgi:peptide deformylase